MGNDTMSRRRRPRQPSDVDLQRCRRAIESFLANEAVSFINSLSRQCTYSKIYRFLFAVPASWPTTHSTSESQSAPPTASPAFLYSFNGAPPSPHCTPLRKDGRCRRSRPIRSDPFNIMYSPCTLPLDNERVVHRRRVSRELSGVDSQVLCDAQRAGESLLSDSKGALRALCIHLFDDILTTTYLPGSFAILP